MLKHSLLLLLMILNSANCYSQVSNIETPRNEGVKLGAPRIEFIGYRNSNGNENYNNQIQARFFQPIDWNNGWTSMSRIDGTITSNSGPKSYTAGNNWQMGNTRWTFSTSTPELSEGFKMNGGWRVYFPIGSLNTSYSTAQWEAGPQAGFSYSSKNWGPIVSISPFVRYLMGFDPISQNTQSVRTMEVFPTIITKLTEYTRLHFYDENAITLNANKGYWNIPFDAMLVHSFNDKISGKLGGSIKMNNSPATPNWNAYTGIVYQF